MSRDQRVLDNPSLELAVAKGRELGLPVLSCFCLSPQFLGATIRQYGFMLRGLEEVRSSLEGRGIGFQLLTGSPERELPGLISDVEAALLVTDFDPLRLKLTWKEAVLKAARIPAYEVDAHNIVPCWQASPKREYSAATFRPKLRRLLPSFLSRPNPLPSPSIPWRDGITGDIQAARRALKVDRGVEEVSWARPGERAALTALRDFVARRLPGYAEARNDPLRDGQSGLSPYLHFGQLSPQRAAWEVRSSSAPQEDKEAFLEELIVRRELSDNFCLHAPDYDTPGCFPEWAKASLDQHRFDRREHAYAEAELEAGRTHDPLWNAAQREMVLRGKMHGYLRMYWAKKTLEWCSGPEEAMRIAVRLNDRYELDGRDPNGYTGIAWSIGGVHDRAWPSRPIFGKVRYMSLSGARSKFDVDAYVRRAEAL
jgi:deoxyribodipyrimidine photo-lyase